MARRSQRRFVRVVDRIGAESTTDAVAAIVAGLVTVNGLIVTNPEALIASDAVVAVTPERVLRGTGKLRAAFRGFPAVVSGRVCLDVGAAAGGFTAALLEADAKRVNAVDVGYGQLVGWLRQDARVVNLERTNLADLSEGLIPEPVEVICLDLSYLALSDAIPQLTWLDLADDAQLLALVKPTFELHAPSMITDGQAVDRAVAAPKVAAGSNGWSMDRRIVPVQGRGGAPEMFIYGTYRPNYAPRAMTQ